MICLPWYALVGFAVLLFLAAMMGAMMVHDAREDGYERGFEAATWEEIKRRICAEDAGDA